MLFHFKTIAQETKSILILWSMDMLAVIMDMLCRFTLLWSRLHIDDLLFSSNY